MKDIVTNVLTLVDETATGEGSTVDTIGTREHREGSARFFLNVTGFTGTSADFDVVTTLDGVDFVLGSFTQATGVTSEVISISDCPSWVKIEYTLAAVTDLDCVVTCVRF